jgi:hypothetical protein
LVSSIYILFPKEHPELVANAMQHFRWAVERFEAMSERNALARSALGVLRAIRIRLEKSLAKAGHDPSASPDEEDGLVGARPQVGFTGSETTASPSLHSAPSLRSSSSFAGPSSTPGSVVDLLSAPLAPPSLYEPPQQPQQQPDAGFDLWSPPADFDWASIQPIFATGDLIYNDLAGASGLRAWDDLSGVSGGLTTAHDSRNNAGNGASDGTPVATDQPWQFEGDFGNDSVWNLLNQFAGF